MAQNSLEGTEASRETKDSHHWQNNRHETVEFGEVVNQSEKRLPLRTRCTNFTDKRTI